MFDMLINVLIIIMDVKLLLVGHHSGFTQVALWESWPIDVYDPNTKLLVCNSSNSIYIIYNSMAAGSSETFTFCNTIGPDLVLNVDKYLSLALCINCIYSSYAILE